MAAVGYNPWMASWRRPQRPRRFPGFRPYQPPPPPAGSFDPALTAQREAATRGLRDVRQDTELAGARAGQDFAFGIESVDRSLGRGNEDLDHRTMLLKRSYDQLAARQRDQAAAQGVLRGGAVLQSAAKRAENQAIGQGEIDVDRARLRDDRDVAAGRLGVEFDRGVTDRTTGLARAEREDTAFGLDVGAQKMFQAGQVGYVPPVRGEAGGIPRHEFVTPGGRPYREVARGGLVYKVGPDGRIIGAPRRRRR